MLLDMKLEALGEHRPLPRHMTHAQYLWIGANYCIRKFGEEIWKWTQVNWPSRVLLGLSIGLRSLERNIFMKIWSVVIVLLGTGRDLCSTHDFQNLMECSLYRPNPSRKFQQNPFITSWVILLTDEQTDRNTHTNHCQQKHNQKILLWQK